MRQLIEHAVAGIRIKSVDERVGEAHDEYARAEERIIEKECASLDALQEEAPGAKVGTEDTSEAREIHLQALIDINVDAAEAVAQAREKRHDRYCWIFFCYG